MKTRAEHISIPLADFLRLNDHGLLDSCHELEHWESFLNFLADFMQLTEFHTRGSCVALATLRWIGELPLHNDDEIDIKHSLVPYTTFSELHREDPEEFVELSEQERRLYELIMNSSPKKNIDIYLQLTDPEQIALIAEKLASAFNDLHSVRVVSLRMFPNGIAALTVDVKGGYVDHEVVIALKPPLKKDLRKASSKRQKAAQAKLQQNGKEWSALIGQKNVEKLTEADEFDFLKEDLSLVELLLHLFRAVRFNTIYPSSRGGLNSELKRAGNTISSLMANRETAQPTNEIEASLLHQIMNECMIAFLHNPELVIELLLLLPDDLFPFINRRALEQNRVIICQFLSQKPDGYFETPKERHVHLTQLILWLSGTQIQDLEQTQVAQSYQETIDTLDEKIRMTPTIEQFDTHSTWYFPKYSDFYLFQLLFQPIRII